jgi:fucose 4-O-acetylase-like acetyltransferase
VGARDHGIDALRAIAISGVVFGHWLITAIVVRPDGSLATASPVAAIGWLAPATWLFQTLGLFFFVAGYAAGRSSTASRSSTGGRPSTAGQWGRRWGGLLRPVLGFAAAWTLLLTVATVAGVPDDSLRTVARLAVSPLWFIAVLAALSAVTAPVRRIVAAPHGLALLVTGAVAVVAVADAGAGIAVLTTLVAWLVPYALGAALAAGRLRGRRIAWALLLGGLIALPVLIAAGYPNSAVGVPGVGRSNLNPPSLATVALAMAQAGAALLVRERLAHWQRSTVDTVNRAAMRIYLWHQTALISVTIGVLWLIRQPVPALHTAPDGGGWALLRLLWLPVFLAALALGLRLTGRAKSPPRRDFPAVDRDVRPSPTVGLSGCTLSDVSDPDDSLEVIAVRDSDPPSRGRAARQPR